MNITRVWNISDHPETEVKPRTLMIFGKLCAPGHYVLVNEDMLKNAHKIAAEAKAGLLHVGAEPPASYAAAKSKARAPVRKGAARSHGHAPVAAAEKPVDTQAETAVLPATDTVTISETSEPVEGVVEPHHRRRRGF